MTFKATLDKLWKPLASWFEMNRIVAIVMFIAIALALRYYSDGKNFMPEFMEQQPQQTQAVLPSVAPAPATDSISTPAGYKPATTANPSDLLPNDKNSEWGELNMLGNGGLAMPDLLQAGYHIGLDTIGQSLRNANLQERSDPVIPLGDTGPWNKSTIEPDQARIPRSTLEIGDCHK